MAPIGEPIKEWEVMAPEDVPSTTEEPTPIEVEVEEPVEV